MQNREQNYMSDAQMQQSTPRSKPTTADGEWEEEEDAATLEMAMMSITIDVTFKATIEIARPSSAAGHWTLALVVDTSV